MSLVKSGKCPSGDTPIELATAPTSLAVSGSVSVGHSRNAKAKVGGFTFGASCSEDSAEHLTAASLTVGDTSPFDIQGSEVFTGNDTANLYTTQGTSYSTGAGQITYATPASDPFFQFTLSEDGGVTGDVLLVQGGHTETVAFAFFAFSGNCSVQAQITPSS